MGAYSTPRNSSAGVIPAPFAIFSSVIAVKFMSLPFLRADSLSLPSPQNAFASLKVRSMVATHTFLLRVRRAFLSQSFCGPIMSFFCGCIKPFGGIA